MLSKSVLYDFRSCMFRDRGIYLAAAHPANDPYIVFLLHDDFVDRFSDRSATAFCFGTERMAQKFNMTTVFVDNCIRNSAPLSAVLDEGVIRQVEIEDENNLIPLKARKNILSQQNQIEKGMHIIEVIFQEKSLSCCRIIRDIVNQKLLATETDANLAKYAAFLYDLSGGNSEMLSDLPAVNQLAQLSMASGATGSQDLITEIREICVYLHKKLTFKNLVDEHINAVVPGGLPEPKTLSDILSQAEMLSRKVEKIGGDQILYDSRVYRVAMYGAHKAGLDVLRKPDTLTESSVAFAVGLLSGPQAILRNVEKWQIDFEQGIKSLGELCDFLLDVLIFTGCHEKLTPNLIKHLQYLRRYQMISRSEVLQDVSLLEKRIINQLSIEEYDRYLYAMVRDYVKLRDRVQLRVRPEDIESPANWATEEASLARRIASSIAMGDHRNNGKVIQALLETFRNIEVEAGCYYDSLLRRGEYIAEKICQEIFHRGLDRVLIHVCAFHFIAVV